MKKNYPSTSNVQVLISGSARESNHIAMKATDVFPALFLPGTRFGTYCAPQYPPGYLVSTPGFTDHIVTASWAGSWLMPDRRYCNPLEWLVTTKASFSHTGMMPQSGLEKKSGVWLVKMSVCLKANCAVGDLSCPRVKCYVSKTGKCVQFNTNVFPEYMSVQAKADSQYAAAEFAAGNYVECGETAQMATRALIAGS